MANSRRRIVSREPLRETATGREELEVCLAYWDGRTRGYFVTVQPWTRKPEVETLGGRTFEVATCWPLAGRSALVEAAPRFNARRLATLTPPPELVARLRAESLAAHEESEGRNTRAS